MSKQIKPKALFNGAKIGISAASSPFLRSKFLQGVETLKTIGFEVLFAKGIADRKKSYLAGTDRERAEELNRLFADKSLSAIMFARGGYGIQRIMPYLDFDALKKYPKLIIGYSDITALTSYLTSELNMTAVYGPVVTALGAPRGQTVSLLKKLISAKRPDSAVYSKGLKVLKKGNAKGKLVGGCLSLIVSSIGTPYQLDTDGSILFLEDVGEKVYKYDRMLTQMKNAGQFKKVRGVVFGSLGLDQAEANPDALLPMLEDIFDDLKVPVVYGLESGHTEPLLSLPLGVKCSLTAKSSAVIKFGESPVK